MNDKTREEFDEFYKRHALQLNLTPGYYGREKRIAEITWQHQQSKIDALERQLAESNEYIDKISMLIGACDCIAGKGDPPMDCDAPKCLNIERGVENLKRQNRELREAMNKALDEIANGKTWGPIAILERALNDKALGGE